MKFRSCLLKDFLALLMSLTPWVQKPLDVIRRVNNSPFSTCYGMFFLCTISYLHCQPVLQIRIRRIRMFLGLQDPDLDPVVRCTDPDPLASSKNS
jgi:hypothetical protein